MTWAIRLASPTRWDEALTRCLAVIPVRPQAIEKTWATPPMTAQDAKNDDSADGKTNTDGKQDTPSNTDGKTGGNIGDSFK